MCHGRPQAASVSFNSFMACMLNSAVMPSIWSDEAHDPSQSSAQQSAFSSYGAQPRRTGDHIPVPSSSICSTISLRSGSVTSNPHVSNHAAFMAGPEHVTTHLLAEHETQRAALLKPPNPSRSIPYTSPQSPKSSLPAPYQWPPCGLCRSPVGG